MSNIHEFITTLQRNLPGASTLEITEGKEGNKTFQVFII